MSRIRHRKAPPYLLLILLQVEVIRAPVLLKGAVFARGQSETGITT